MKTQRRRDTERRWPGGRDGSDDATCRRMLGATSSWGRPGRTLPRSFRGSAALSTPGFPPASLRSCEELDFRCLKSPSPEKLGQHGGQENGIRRLARPGDASVTCVLFRPTAQAMMRMEMLGPEGELGSSYQKRGPKAAKARTTGVHSAFNALWQAPSTFWLKS